MAINYTRFFTTVGKILGGLDETNTSRYTTLFTRADAIGDRFESVFTDQIPDLYTSRDTALTGLNAWTSYLKTLAQRTLLKEVQADNVTVPADLEQLLVELRRQMVVDGQSLQNASLASAISSAFLNGNVGSVPADYHVNNLLVGTFAETFLRPDHYTFTPTTGSDNGATEYQETFSIKGDEFQYSKLDARWPAGENVATSVEQIDPKLDDWFTADATAGDWSELTVPSTASVDVRGDTTTVYQGTFASPNTVLQVSQLVGDNMRPNTWYCAYILVQQNSSQSIQFQAELLTGTGGTMYAGAEISVTQNFTVNTATGRWQTIGVLFRTKEKIPDLATLKITLTALGSSVQVSACYPGMSEGKVVEVYPLGPAFALLSGNYPAVYPNRHTVTVGSHTTAPKMVRGMERLFDAATFLPQGLPVSGSPTISDALVV